MSAAAQGSSQPRPRLDTAAFPSMGPGQLRPGRDHDAIDEVVPQAVITAREPEHVEATIDEARGKGLGIVASGGSTLLHVGAPPRNYDIRLSMTAIADIVEQNPEDMTITCQAGVSLSRLQRSLAKVGQRLALDIAREDRASIGGIVAANAAGGLRHAFGLPRDLVLGLRAIDGCGRSLRAGGQVVKNVAGYDLVRLLCGSRGSLAILTEVTLRTHPLPAAGATLVFEFVSPAELDAARARLLEEPLPLSALDFAVDASGPTTLWILAVRVEGTEEEVADQGDRVCAVVGRQPADAVEEWESPAEIDDGTGVTFAVRARPADLVAALTAMIERFGKPGAAMDRVALRIGGHLGDGFARIHLTAGEGAATTALFDGFAALSAATGPGGAIRSRVLERAPRALKTTHEVWGPPPASLRWMQAIKKRFDPDDVLAPGRFVGGL